VYESKMNIILEEAKQVTEKDTADNAIMLKMKIKIGTRVHKK
jgi:hypothetical protein